MASFRKEFPAELTAIVVGSKRKYRQARMQWAPIFLLLSMFIWASFHCYLKISACGKAKQQNFFLLGFAALPLREVRLEGSVRLRYLGIIVNDISDGALRHVNKTVVIIGAGGTKHIFIVPGAGF